MTGSHCYPEEKTRSLAILSVVLVATSPLATGCSRGRPDVAVAQVEAALVQPQVASISVPAGVDFKPLAAAASSALTVSDRAQLLGAAPNTFANSTSTGTITSSYGTQVKVGSVTSLPAVSFGAGATVSGPVTSGSTISGTPAGVTVSPNQPLAASTYKWTVPFNTSTAPVTLNSGSVTLAPGSYGTVQVNGGTLTLNPGTYYIDTLTLQSSTNLTLNNASAPIFIYVRSSLAFRTHVTGTAGNLMLVYFGSTSAAIETTFKGTFIAPNASIRVGVGATPHVGAVFAKTLMIDPDVKLTQTAFARWDLVPFDVGVSPTVNCVTQLDANTYGAVFGYNNTTGATVTLGVGAHNLFSPGPADLGQPILFVPGAVPIATFQRFAAGSQLTLTVGQQSVTASASSPICPADLASTLTQLYTETPDSLAVRQSIANLVAHPRFAAWMTAVRTNGGSTLSPFDLSLLDAVQLAIANADLLGDPAALTVAQQARVPAFRASLLANPAITRLRLAGDAMKGSTAKVPCDVLGQIDRTQPYRPLLPAMTDSVFAQTLAIGSSAELARLRSTVAGVANGPLSAALLAAPGVVLAGILSPTDIAMLDLAGPIPTGLFGKIVGAIAGGVAGAIAGFAVGGPAGAVAGAIIGGVAGAEGGNEIENAECHHCGTANDCPSGSVNNTCADGCCIDFSSWGISGGFLTGVSCQNGQTPCRVDGSCDGQARCAEGCCVDQTLLVSLCPASQCTSSADCAAGNTCQSGCCAGVCGVNGTACNEVGSAACGLVGGSCSSDQTCDSGCCVLSNPPK